MTGRDKRILTGIRVFDEQFVEIPKTKFAETLPQFLEMSPSLPMVPVYDPFSVRQVELRFTGAIQQVLDRWPHLTVRVEMLSSLVFREMQGAEQYLPATHSLEYEVTESLVSVCVRWQLTDRSGYRSLSGNEYKSPWQTTLFHLPDPPPKPKAPEPDEEPKDDYDDWPLH